MSNFFASFGETLPIMGMGMLAIFAVMVLVFALVKVLNKVTK
jgi:hypothetical protein